MLFDPLYLLYGAIFLAILLLVEGIYYFLLDSRGGPEETINRRLRMLATTKDGRKVLYRLRRANPNQRQWYLVGPIAKLDQLISQTGLTVSTSRMLVIMAGLMVLVFVLLVAGAAMPNLSALVFAAATGVLVPIIYLRRRRNARTKRFGEQLPEAIDIMVRSMRAGHPLSSSIGLVAREMPDPIGSEFGIVSDEMTYGLDLQAALDNMARRVPLQDFHYMVVAINIQHSTGGNLAEILSNLSKVIRDRFRMFKKINALSAEGRLSAGIIASLPFVAALGMHLISPDYYAKYANDPIFLMIIGSGALGLLFGIFVMYRIVNFRV